ncbi:uncharacterized protein EV420DRAFT_1484559 [Desarmillaria tabescens]|uniref:Uncharacterized protein n=1 Tax=Armillaria tabescens TaxID=1929756 RepID=A0AA39JLU8_ARMTA|nr:uncharacterized protein EV420DRAFT_1484559 [Desarmillaria tabescens]KAK0444597.1 hypothetical protein EV420DRAFT_1484559 [Desarmillaria tabescens]
MARPSPSGSGCLLGGSIEAAEAQFHNEQGPGNHCGTRDDDFAAQRAMHNNVIHPYKEEIELEIGLSASGPEDHVKRFTRRRLKVGVRSKRERPKGEAIFLGSASTPSHEGED